MPFQNLEGQKVPQATFRARTESEWTPVTTDDIFKGKTVVVFSLPGAFTPTWASIASCASRSTTPSS